MALSVTLLSFFARASFATLSCVSSLAVAPMCGIWHTKLSTPPCSSRSSIRHSAVLAPPPQSSAAFTAANGYANLSAVGALGLEPHSDIAQQPASRALHRGDTYTTAGESFQAIEHLDETLSETTSSPVTPPPGHVLTEEPRGDEVELGDTIITVFQPPNAPHVKTRRLVLSISLLTQVCIVSIESLW